MTTDTVLLLLILLGAIASIPGAYALYRQRSQQLTITAAQQLEQELEVRMGKMHGRILKLENENTDLQSRLDSLRVEVSNLEHKNMMLTSAVRRLIKQIESNGLHPDISIDDLGRLLA